MSILPPDIITPINWCSCCVVSVASSISYSHSARLMQCTPISLFRIPYGILHTVGIGILAALVCLPISQTDSQQPSHKTLASSRFRFVFFASKGFSTSYPLPPCPCSVASRLSSRVWIGNAPIKDTSLAFKVASSRTDIWLCHRNHHPVCPLWRRKLPYELPAVADAGNRKFGSA